MGSLGNVQIIEDCFFSPKVNLKKDEFAKIASDSRKLNDSCN